MKKKPLKIKVRKIKIEKSTELKPQLDAFGPSKMKNRVHSDGFKIV